MELAVADEPICVCSRCGLEGYYLSDLARQLCHLCLYREALATPIIEDLLFILRRDLDNLRGPRWQGCEFAKAFMGNATLQALSSYGVEPSDAIARAKTEAYAPPSLPSR